MIQMVKTNLICSICQTVFPLIRSKGNRRKHLHKKHLYCFKCKEITMHLEQVKLDIK